MLSVEPKPTATNPPETRSRREVELRKLIPNLMTGGAFCCGVASIYFASKYSHQSPDTSLIARAIGLLGASFLLDGLDGRMARMLKVTSRFGEKFDSIADFVSFGLAPAFILYKWKLIGFDELGFGVSVMYTLCAAIRLARFTAQAKKKTIGAPVSKFFQGLPAPAAAFVVLIPAMLALSPLFASKIATPSAFDWTETWVLWAVVTHTLLVAGLMVSTIPMASVKHVKINRSLLIPLLIGIGAIAVCMIKDAWLTLSVLAFVYLLSLPLSVMRARSLASAR